MLLGMMQAWRELHILEAFPPLSLPRGEAPAHVLGQRDTWVCCYRTSVTGQTLCGSALPAGRGDLSDDPHPHPISICLPWTVEMVKRDPETKQSLARNGHSAINHVGIMISI